MAEKPSKNQAKPETKDLTVEERLAILEKRMTWVLNKIKETDGQDAHRRALGIR